MKKKILALYDGEAEYTRRFCDYAKKKKDLPFEIAAFTSKKSLEEYCYKEEVDLLLISENAVDETIKDYLKGNVIVLRNDENKAEENVESIYKYQSCEAILQEVMNFMVDTIPESMPLTHVQREMGIKMMGFYSPVHRSLQTTLALAVGEALSKKYRVLYLNFESFSGWEQRMRKRYMNDLSDLIYYAANAKEALFYKLKSMTQTLKGLDYIPPAFSYIDIARISTKQWFDLFTEIEKQSDYEYLILDLSDNMQGLFEIMRSCERIITLIREDGAASAKLFHYEKLLDRTEYEDIKEKTRQFKAPLIRNISEDPMSYTHGELAEIARSLIDDL